MLADLDSQLLTCQIDTPTVIVTQKESTGASYNDWSNNIVMLPTGGLVTSPVADLVMESVEFVRSMPILPVDEEFDAIANEAFSNIYKGSKAKLIRE